MQFEIEKLSDIRQKITFSVPAEEVDAELRQVYDRLKKRARIPGFRPGKAPRSVLRRRFGEQASSEVASSFFRRAFEGEIEGMDYFGQPRVETEGLKEGRDFAFSFILEVEPEPELGQYKGLEVVFPEAEVSEELVEARIAALLQSRASLAELTEPRPIRAGDSVMVALTARSVPAEEGGEGEVLDQAPGTMIEVGKESWFKGLDEHLIGKEMGEAFTVALRFPEDAGNSAVAGREVTVEGEVLSIQELRPPELSDEVAEELGYEGGAEGMRAAVRARLQEGADAAARNQARANLLQILVNSHDFSVPEALSEQFFEALVQEMQLQQWQMGRDIREVRFSDAEVADLSSRARFAAKAGLILKWVADSEQIVVDDAELDAKINEIAEQRGQRVEAIKAYLQKEDALEQLRDRILEEKTLDWLLEQSELVAPSAASDAAPAADEAAPAEE